MFGSNICDGGTPQEAEWIHKVGPTPSGPTPQTKSLVNYIYIHLHLADAFIQSALHKNICQKKEKQQYIALGTERMFIEPSAKH